MEIKLIYLANRVLNAALRETQEFLKCTALLPTIDGEMADALLDWKGSYDVLGELYRRRVHRSS